MKKVNFLCLILLGLFFTACHSNDDTWGDWSKTGVPQFNGDHRVSAVAFQAVTGKNANNVYVGMGYGSITDPDKNLKDFKKFNGQAWSSNVPDFPDALGGRTGSVAFVIGKYAYVGAGWRQRFTANAKDIYFDTFYAFDTETETWAKGVDGAPGCKFADAQGYSFTKISEFFPGKEKECSFYSGIGFSLNGKGYVGTGQIDGRALQTIYCFDPETGTWSDAGFTGDPRVGAVTFTINNQAVVCLGAQVDRSSNYVKDVWVFDGTTWHAKAPLVDTDGGWNDDYGKIPRGYAVAFTSNLDSKSGVAKGYIAGGSGNGTTCWEYNIETDRWDEVTKFPAEMGSMRIGAVGFSINQYGYITTGGTSLSAPNDNSTWRFIPGIDEDDNNDY